MDICFIVLADIWTRFSAGRRIRRIQFQTQFRATILALVFEIQIAFVCLNNQPWMLSKRKTTGWNSEFVACGVRG